MIEQGRSSLRHFERLGPCRYEEAGAFGHGGGDVPAFATSTESARR
jgi:hypothetical protein